MAVGDDAIGRALDRLFDAERAALMSACLIGAEFYQAEQHRFRQATRGRPGPNTRYVRKTGKFYQLRWSLNEEALAYLRRTDGMYLLLTNDRSPHVG